MGILRAAWTADRCDGDNWDRLVFRFIKGEQFVSDSIEEATVSVDQRAAERESVEQVAQVRDRLLPMLAFAAEEYRHRTPPGYPIVVDAVDRGMVGLELDASYALYVVADSDGLYADMYRQSPRNDTRSSASRQKHAGLPFHDRRPLDPNVSDQSLRNLIAELMSLWNFQPGIIHITDS